jgi:type II secretory pathway component HofQ
MRLLKANTFTLLLGLLICVMVFTPVSAQTPPSKMTHKIIRIGHRPAESLVEAAKVYQSADGVIVTDERTNSLIVKDYPENIAKIEQLVKDLDIPQPMVRVYVNYNGLGKSGTAGIRGGAVKTSKGWSYWAQPDYSSGTSSHQTSMNLAIVSGSDGFIKIGEVVPYTEWFYQYAYGRRYIASNVVFQEVTTGFFVSPTVRGKEVDLSIAPGIYYFDGKKRNKIIFREARTEVTMRDGQTMVIGSGNSSDQHNWDLLSHILGAVSSHQKEVFSFTVTVKIMKGM